MSRVIGYVRVSTDDQVDSGLSVASQRSRIEAWAHAQGYPVAAMHTDAGVTGRLLERPGLSAALGALQARDILLAVKLDRFTRAGARGLDYISEQVHSRGASWATIEGSYDTSTATGRLLLRLVAEIARWEREEISERTVAALREKRRQGYWTGRAPYGWRLTGEAPRGVLEPVPDEIRTLLRIRELRTGGATLRRIAERLNAEGYLPRYGDRWHLHTVHCIVKRSTDPRLALPPAE